MLSESAAKRLVHEGTLSQSTRLLILLAIGDNPKSVEELRQLGKKAGISGIRNWHVSQLLSGSKGKAIHTPEGWELGPSGLAVVEPLAGPLLASAAPKAAVSLRAHLAALSNPATKAFVEEAIGCLENRLFRSAVVLSWVGAVSVLYEHVVVNELAAFNTEASRRDSKWKAATNSDGLARMKEYDFLQVLETIGVIGKSVKSELESSLKLRNGCGHPSSLVVGESRVSSHIEVLLLNVFARF